MELIDLMALNLINFKAKVILFNIQYVHRMIGYRADQFIQYLVMSFPLENLHFDTYIRINQAHQQMFKKGKKTKRNEKNIRMSLPHDEPNTLYTAGNKIRIF